MRLPVYTCVLRKSGTITVAGDKPPIIRNPGNALPILHKILKDSPTEKFVALYINSSNQLIGVETIAQGGVGACAMTPSDIFRGGIVLGAAAIIVAHNHPSGDPTPSFADIQMTEAMKMGSSILGIAVLDHLVYAVGPDRKGRVHSIMDYEYKNSEEAA
jgi:DNA repair protein RadC